MYPFGGFPDSSVGKESTCNVGDLGSIPGSGRSPGEGKGYPLQDSGLENSMICRVHRIANSQTWRNDFHFYFGGLVWLMGKTPCVRARGKYIWEFSSVAQSCSTLCDLMDCSTSGFPVHHQLPELAQTHVHWVGDAILPSHPLLSPSPPAFNLSQHQGVFQWVSSSHWGQSMRVSASASILPMNIQDWFPLRLTVIYICIHIHIYLSIWEGISIPPVHFCCGPKTVKNRGVQCIGPMGTQAVEEGETHVGSSPPETSFFPTSLVFFHKSA